MPFFGDGLTMFGCLGFIVVLAGGLIGGVVGVLLPKTTTGLSLGVFVSLFICTVTKLLSYLFYLFCVGISNTLRGKSF